MLPIRLIRPLRHILFWAGIIVFFSSFEFFNSQTLRANADYVKLYWINFFVESLPTYLCFTYALLYGIVPLLLQKRFILCLAWLGGAVVLSILVQKAFSEIDFYLVQPFLLNLSSDISFSFSSAWEDLKHLEDWITFSYDFIVVGFAAVGIKLFSAWLAKEQENQHLGREKLQTELKLLKLQLNPTFLFGTLSTLHDLTQYQPEQAPEVVLKLAQFLRYVLYETQEDTVPLGRELEVISDYVFLQRISHPKLVEVSFTVRGTIANQSIAPLSLLPIVENTFRQLPAELTEPTWVSIDLAVTETQITLKVISELVDRPDYDTSRSTNLGGLQKQLAFYYPNNHSIKIWREAQINVVTLSISFPTNSVEPKPLPTQPIGSPT